MFMLALLGLAVASCDRKGSDLLPDNGKFSPVATIGELAVLTPQDYWEYRSSADPQAWCNERVDADGDGVVGDDEPMRCYYGQLSMPEPGVVGGSSYTFEVPSTQTVDTVDGPETSDVEEICILVDPETVFWNHSMAELDRESQPIYPDFHDDDGDLDLFAGMSSYYTGSPGVELGDFRGFYTDSLGRTIEIEYGECEQRGINFGEHHAGRAALEYCDIDVSGRGGVQFTVVMETFSVPLNDGSLSYGTVVYGGRCSDIVPTPGEELVIPQESLEPSGKPGSFEARACTAELEVAVAGEVEQSFCCAHPGLCSPRAPDDSCATFIETYDPVTGSIDTATAEFCRQTKFTEYAEGSSYLDSALETRSICCPDEAAAPFDPEALHDPELETYKVISAHF
jgi:hypothetical protein